MTEKQPKFPANRLAGEKSPYLLQHAHNPVDWYPWGHEAFAAAKRRDCPILLSIGYSTCHWCHVMERESFEDPSVAEVMNGHFVSIKVDREERPDIDAVYMNAVNALTGAGGWPLNVFLTPERKPFFGGTYFPPETRHGIIAWRDLLLRIAELWRSEEQRRRIDESAARLTTALSQASSTAENGNTRPTTHIRAGAVAHLKKTFDADRGGFGNAPKFPMPPLIDFLLTLFPSDGAIMDGEQKAARDMSLSTLDAIAKGGIRDHLGGGFHRYATDPQWHVPHFEKMLYDNAQLAATYARAYSLTAIPDYRRVTEDTIAYVLRDLGHPDGGFYSAEDADSPPSDDPDAGSVEGAFYVWTHKEITDRLSPDEAEAIISHYGVRDGGNVSADPHGQFSGKNIFYVARPVAAVAEHCGVTGSEAAALIDAATGKLMEARGQRPRPHLDDKIITEWNAMMIAALAQASIRLDHPEWLREAARAAAFLRNHLYDADRRQLYRRWRQDERQIPGMATDYAHLVNALLDVFLGSGDCQWLDWAVELADELLTRFFDAEAGGFTLADVGFSQDLIVKAIETADGVMPSASAAAASALMRLGNLLHLPRFSEAAMMVIRAQTPHIAQHPTSAPVMLGLLDAADAPPMTIFVAGDAGAPDTLDMVSTIRQQAGPKADVVVISTPDTRTRLSRHLPAAAHMMPVAGKAAAFVCIGTNCMAPENRPEAVVRLLTEKHLGR